VPTLTRVAVPGGVWRSGHPVREVALRAVGTEDEAFLLDTAADDPPGDRATALLARCLTDGERIVPALTVGDREALLLHLRRLSLGDTVHCVLRCPASSCREQMEATLRIEELLLPPYEDVYPSYDLTVEVDGVRYEATFRLPTADDLAGVAALARQHPEQAGAALFRRCLLAAARDGEPVDACTLPPVVQDAISDAMADRDPQAELRLELTCTACDTRFSIVFDTATFLLEELERRANRLLGEVHTLALHYHWSEADILRMSPTRRAKYLDLLAGLPPRAGTP
jgi:hypothetical protein